MFMKNLILLSALASIAGAWNIDSYGDINGFSWLKGSKDISSIRTRENVSFWNAHFEHFSKEIGDQFTNMKKLKFTWGTVQQIYINPKIEELFMHQTKIQKLEIDPDQEYAIISLNVGDCNLKSIPSNINHLRRLQKLDFWGNQIEHVKMSDFNGLNNLEELGLNDNGMKTLSSETTINLPKLRVLWIHYNKLLEVDICSWEMPNLKKFDLDRNELKFIVNLVDQFPKIEKIEISLNPLVCSWKDDFVRSAESKNISLESDNRKPTCNATDTSHAPSENPMVYCLSKQKSNILERQRSFEQLMRDSTERIESLEQLVKKSNDENLSLRQTIATLTDQHQKTAKKSSEEIKFLTDQLQQMAKKSNEENQSLTDQLQQMAKKSNDEIQLLKQKEATLTDQLHQMVTKSSEENQSLTDQLTKLHHLIDDLTEGFYRYVLEKEGGEK